ncbi:MAG TPA: hypothetical protein VM056_02450 [Terriglobales bacterium]|nr:hypothetical protein [Terriglobales bacterium]
MSQQKYHAKIHYTHCNQSTYVISEVSSESSDKDAVALGIIANPKVATCGECGKPVGGNAITKVELNNITPTH